MVHFIYGRTGSGKSSFIYEKASATPRGKHIYVIVPDREAVIAENLFAKADNAGDIDVVTFSRLCNFVFRKYGGICENYISRGAKTVMMYNTFRAVSDMLLSYKGVPGGDVSTAKKLVAMRSELHKNAVSPHALSSAVKDVPDETGKKISDFSFIFSAFDAELSSRFEDPDGMIEKMNKKLSENDFFEGSDVYIDSFTSFSKEQIKTLKMVMRGAENVYIALPYIPYEDENIPCFSSVFNTDKKLRAAASDVKKEIGEDVLLAAGKRAENTELSFLSSNLYSEPDGVLAVYNDETGHIRIIGASDAFAESEAVCLDICKKIRGGARYRDFGIIVRNISEYTGIIDAMMRKYSIPYFISSRTDIKERAFIKYIMSALYIAERGFLRDLVISYIKTDFAGIDADEINLFENYVRKWSINGSRFSDEYDWNMNPDGYREFLTEEGERKLIKLSEIRKKVIRPLVLLKEELSGIHSVRYYCEKIYSFAVNSGAPEKIKNDGTEAERRGERMLSEEMGQLFSVFCDLLDALVSASGDTEVGIGEFIALFSLVISETDIGKIPTSLDEVTVFEVSAGGMHDIKTAYIMGAYDGGFPAGVSDDGLFSEKEIELLSSCGIEIFSDMQTRLCDEMYFFYSAVCSASKDVIISYPYFTLSGEKTALSTGALEIKRIFPHIKEERFEDTEKIDLLERPGASFEYVTEKEGPVCRALKDYYYSKEEYSDKLLYITLPLSAEKCRLSKESAEELFPKDIKTSYSKLERYTLCGFYYFCEYELRLKDNAPAKFESLNKGNLIHKILEITAKYAVDFPDATDEELSSKIKNVCREYTESLFRENYDDISVRISRLTDYISRACEKFVFGIRDEFRESRFTPKDFELIISKTGDISPLSLENENGGVALSGKIDRVDAYDDGSGKIYIRVADYKTGNKRFELKNIEAGLDLQMLLYLFSVCENGKKRYGGEVIPAGVMYVSINTSPENVNMGAVSEKKESCKNSGLFLDDDNVLRAMEPSLEGRFIPVKESKTGKKSGNLFAAEQFEELKNAVVSSVMAASDSLRNGVADARPNKEEDPCRYCKMHAVCRIKNTTLKGC